MYYVYYLLSSINKNLYIGSTEDIQKRIQLHNQGRVKSTKSHKPWKLLGYEKFKTRSDAVKRERFLKTHQQKDLLKKKYKITQ